MTDGCSLCLASRLILGILSSQIIFNYSLADHQSDTKRIDPRHETINRQIDSKTRIRGPSSPRRGYYKTIRGNISPAGAPGGARGARGSQGAGRWGHSGPNWFDAGNTFQQNVIFPQTTTIIYHPGGPGEQIYLLTRSASSHRQSSRQPKSPFGALLSLFPIQ